METVCVSALVLLEMLGPLWEMGTGAGIAHPGGTALPNPSLMDLGECPGQDPTPGTAPGLLQGRECHGQLWGSCGIWGSYSARGSAVLGVSQAALGVPQHHECPRQGWEGPTVPGVP